MSKKNTKSSAKELIIQFLKKNKNLFLDYPELLNELNFPSQIKGSGKIIDLNFYRSKKIKNEYEELKRQMSKILKAGSSPYNFSKKNFKNFFKSLEYKILNKIN